MFNIEDFFTQQALHDHIYGDLDYQEALPRRLIRGTQDYDYAGALEDLREVDGGAYIVTAPTVEENLSQSLGLDASGVEVPPLVDVDTSSGGEHSVEADKDSGAPESTLPKKEKVLPKPHFDEDTTTSGPLAKYGFGTGSLPSTPNSKESASSVKSSHSHEDLVSFDAMTSSQSPSIFNSNPLTQTVEQTTGPVSQNIFASGHGGLTSMDSPTLMSQPSEQREDKKGSSLASTEQEVKEGSSSASTGQEERSGEKTEFKFG